ncbi:MAG: hypothetical protein RhofKO_01470 [Rhodothermales bacterium]
MRSSSLALLSALLLLATGCDLLGSNNDDTLVTTGVIVANAGNFSDQNGFLTVYDPETQTAADLPNLGGFVQSVTVHNGIAYAAINTFGEGRIDVVNLDSGTRTGQITGLGSPRSLAFADDTGYFTSFAFGGPNEVRTFDVATQALSEVSIATTASPEGLILTENKGYVANSGFGSGTTLTVFSRATNAVVGTIDLGCDGPTEVGQDGDGEIVVVCHGNTVFNDDFSEILSQTDGQIVFVDPANDQVTARITFDEQLGAASGTQAATIVRETGEAYAMASSSGTLYRIDTRGNQIAEEVTVPADDRLTGLSGIAYDVTRDLLYVGRMPVGAGGFADFTSAGTVIALNRAFEEVSRFPVGPSVAHIALRTENQ